MGSKLKKIKEISSSSLKRLGDSFGEIGEKIVRPIKNSISETKEYNIRKLSNLVVSNKKKLGMGAAVFTLGVGVLALGGANGTDVGFAGSKSVEVPTKEVVAKYSSPMTTGYSIYVDGVAYGFFPSEDTAKYALGLYNSIYAKPINMESQVLSVSYKQSVVVAQNKIESDKLKAFTNAEDVVKLLQTARKEKTTYKVKKKDSLAAIAKANSTSVAELKKSNKIKNAKALKAGKTIEIKKDAPAIEVVTTQNIVRKVTVKYKVVTEESNKLYKGKIKVKTKGVNGETLEMAEATVVNGEIASKNVTNAQVLSVPVDKVVIKGTKKRPVSRGDGDSDYSNGSLLRPVKVGFVISGYGYRGSEFHKALDFAVPMGTPIYASEDGVVTNAAFNGPYGYNIIINHGNGISTRYAHNSSNKVSVGDRVSRGDVIGYAGRTGNATGPHVHFEVIKNGVQVNPTNYISR